MSAESSLASRVENLVHEETQRHDNGVDLTVAAVHTVTAAGSIDFGGGELEDASLEPVPTTTREPDDDYGWWDLEAGRYLLQHNEFIDGLETPVVVQPRNELLARGATHPTVWVQTHLPLLPLAVPPGGLHLKENARISTLLDPVGVPTDSTPE